MKSEYHRTTLYIYIDIYFKVMKRAITWEASMETQREVLRR